ncbi:hypothetical protein FJT64_026302 [Amphibalanus amphitrite]|uniref:Uncharacterized protein n=1 Tax=Amphibalanus amphitrite TaxID=1232801 RepID=A0A6A4WBW5_AMPAM|nr:cuticle protein 16.5-like [Amphibalanus amphitrite]KAF0301294.1 hypothetical protein FJT64_026302 [Amphibalanus amphitrite]
MKVFVALFATLACASAGLVVPATTVLRAPAHDSAVIQSHRFGGNFAYRTDEAHAYAAVSPVVSTVRKAVGVSYSHGAPVVKSTTVEHPVTYAAAPAVTYAAAPAVTYAAAPAVTYAGVPHAYGYAAPHAYGYAAPYGYGYAGLGLPLTFEKVEEAKAEPAVEAAE